MTVTLRKYQRECIDAIEAAHADGVRSPAVLLPTGTGKTVIFSALAARHVRPSGGPLVLVHRDELVRQTVAKVKAMAPHLSTGIIKAGDNSIGDITVASVATLAREKRLSDFLSRTRPSLTIVDECHHATAKSYRTILDAIDAPAVGFTATMVRSDRGKLGDVWERVVFKRDILWAIRSKFLVDVKGYSVKVDDLDIDSVDVRHGDYVDGQLGSAMVESSAGENVVKAYLDHTPNGKAILFAPTIASAQMFTDAFENAGIPAELVIGSTPINDRADIYKRFRKGTTRVMCSVGVLTEGFDEPSADVCIIARPTKSQGLYVQMVGRVLRPSPGKTIATVLDVVGAAREHELASLADLSQTTRMRIEEGEPLSQGTEVTLAEDVTYWDDSDMPAPGPLILEEIDPFAASRSNWLQTESGMWFLATTKRVYFCGEADDGTYRVVASASQRQFSPFTVVGRDLDLGTAMMLAESTAQDDGGEFNTHKRNASFRRGAPSMAQISFANSLGAIITPDMTKRQVADAISIRQASRMLEKIGR